MRLMISAALALLAASSATAQDLSNATPIAGSWTYASTPDGSEAVFASDVGAPQLWVHCTRATRRVTISRAAAAAAPSLSVWTSSLAKSVASSFNAANSRLTIDLANYDPLLDAIIFSRGRVGFTVGTQPALVVPSWAEPARVIEDCRARAAKGAIVTKFHASTSLALRDAMNHLRVCFNAAKGGDPMSHGSAGRSERGVRRP